MAERTKQEIIKEQEQKLLFQREVAYKEVFNKESQHVLMILDDLAKFCRAHESTFNTDERIHALQEGRREVFLRITQHLELSSQELWALYTRRRT